MNLTFQTHKSQAKEIKSSLKQKGIPVTVKPIDWIEAFEVLYTAGHHAKTQNYAFNTPKKSLLKSSYPSQIFVPKNIRESKISNPKKSFDHHRHLKSRVPPPPGPPERLQKCFLLIAWKVSKTRKKLKGYPKIWSQLPALRVGRQTKPYGRHLDPFRYCMISNPHFSLGIVRASGDFQARSQFARSAVPQEKWGLLVVYLSVNRAMFCQS